MNPKKVKNPAQVRERKIRVPKLKCFCNSPIIGHFKPKSQEPGYQKLINYVASGDSESARELLENSGYSGIFADFLLDNAELDMRLEVLGDVLPVRCGDE